MGKNFKMITAVLLMITVISCRKDDDTEKTVSYPEENPLAVYLASTGYNQNTTERINISVFRELGFTFTPKVKGKINAVVLKIPDNEANIRVTVWKVPDKSVLRTIHITNVTAGSEKRVNIDPLELEKDVQYAISFNGNDCYLRSRIDGGNVIYPVSAGNVTINGTAVKPGTDQSFPADTFFDAYEGDISFVFQLTQ